MKLLYGLVEHENVVKVNDKVALINEIGKDGVHKGLKSGRGIAKAEGYDQQFEKAKGAFEGGFPFITLANTDIVISPMDIEFRKIAGTLKFVNKFRNKGQWCSVLDSDDIESTIILDRA